jgi:urease
LINLSFLSPPRVIRGGNNLCDGPIRDVNPNAVIAKVIERGFGHEEQEKILPGNPEVMIRSMYAQTFGPTTEDQVG